VAEKKGLRNPASRPDRTTTRRNIRPVWFSLSSCYPRCYFLPSSLSVVEYPLFLQPVARGIVVFVYVCLYPAAQVSHKRGGGEKEGGGGDGGGGGRRPTGPFLFKRE
jgi:hypothetical protein